MYVQEVYHAQMMLVESFLHRSPALSRNKADGFNNFGSGIVANVSSNAKHTQDWLQLPV